MIQQYIFVNAVMNIREVTDPLSDILSTFKSMRHGDNHLVDKDFSRN